ncbi:MAG: UDP-N-acetylmuramoyl-tripeptide--D-alanyl-D-alanine ligase [Clostridia bacterium]|nr:UDP-N-acetylmuramoyl-tripeptide--D-alanyl-D-alanine ligase [Clostridia bacterium]
MRVALSSPIQDVDVISSALGITPQRVGEVQDKIEGIATDHREIKPGDMFLALRGKYRNGCDFVGDALQKGAVAVLSEGAAFPGENYWHFQVKSTEKALLSLAAARRRLSSATVVAISGSTGKTTLKELIASLLSEIGSVQKSEGNFNSNIGLPLSLLGMQEADFFVLEIGINHVGEMEPLSVMLKPDLAVLTNVGTAHIGNFESRDVLLKEKLKIVSGLSEDGILLLGDGIETSSLASLPQRVLTAGMREDADFKLQNQENGSFGIIADLTVGMRTQKGLSWPVPGSIGASLVALGGAVSALLGLSSEQIKNGFARAARVTPRMRMRDIGPIRVIDDSYNASPEAMAASLEALRYLGGENTAALLGDMGELGSFASCLHNAVGECAAKSHISHLFLYGDFAKDMAEGAIQGGMTPHCVFAYAFGQERMLANKILKTLPRGTTLLCKASRKTALERVMRLLGREL